MKVGIAGAGAIACGSAALLLENGHAVSLWSPGGARTRALATGRPLHVQGALAGHYKPAVAPTAESLCKAADVILIAVPAYGHKRVMNALAPYLGRHQRVIISSHASFGALYLAKLLDARAIAIPIVAWGTTVITGRQSKELQIRITTIRSRVDVCTVPDTASEEGLALCNSLFGQRFVARDGLLAIALSNLNPQNHMGIALANMTRMERGESWSQALNVTPNVGRLLEALDSERLAIAARLGLEVRTIFEHFHLSFHVPVASISEMNRAMHAAGTGGNGPSTADSRYVTEDVPYGLLPTVTLGRMTQCPARLHQAGIQLFSALYGRDFAAENNLLNALQLERLSLVELQELAKAGYMQASS